MKARLVKKLMAISLSLAMIAAMVPADVAAAGIFDPAASMTKMTETAEKESETKKPQGTTASTEKETKTYKTKLVLPGITKKTAVKSLSVKQDGKEYKYDFRNLETSDKGELTLKLPENEKGKKTTVVVNDVTFTGTVTDDDKAELKVAKTTEKETEKTTVKSTEKETEKSSEKTTEKETEKSTEGAAGKETEKETEKTSRGIAADKLLIDGITFESVEYGYEKRPEARDLTIRNTDTASGTQITEIAVSDELELIKPEGTELPTEAKPIELPQNTANIQFKVQPKSGLKAGEHKATVTVKYKGQDTDGSEKVQEKVQEVIFRVEKKTLTLSFGTKDSDSNPYDGKFVYNGSAAVSITAAITGILPADAADPENVKLVKTELEGTMQDANVGIDKAVTLKNSADLALTGKLAENYQLGTVPAVKVTVEQRQLSIKADREKLAVKKVYDGKKTVEAEEGALSLEGIAAGDEGKVKAEGTFEVKSADAGTYTSLTAKEIKLTGDAAANYTAADTLTLECEVVIEKADTNEEPDEVDIASYTYNSVKVRARKGQEYCIVKEDDKKTAKKNWKSTKNSYYTFKGLKASEDYIVYTRIAATKNYKASKEADYEEDDVRTLRNPVVADSSKNTISGISNNGTYKVSNRISFTATGASTGMSTSSLDDVKYLPKSWSTTSTSTSGTWSSSPYSASFTPTKSGTYTLQVTYKKVKYNGSSWVDQNDDYVKKITYTVNSTGRSSSGSSSSTNTSTKRTTAVKTGDTSPIIPLVIVLVVCVAVIGGLGAVSAKKKKQNK